MGLMALDQCMPIPADGPYYPASGAYFFLSPFTWKDFHTQFPRNTKSQRDHSPTRIWNIVCLCLTENMVTMMLSHQVPSSTASSLSTPSENKPSDSSPYPLYTTSTQEPVSPPPKRTSRRTASRQAEWDHEDAALLLVLAWQPWWQLAYSFCTSLLVIVHFTLLKKLTLSHTFQMEIHTYNIHQCNR